MRRLAYLFALVVLTPLAADVPDVVAPGAKAKKLAGGFKFTEGPAADKEGNVYFSDIPNNRIHRWSLDGKLSTFRENSGGANGLYFDREGNLRACEGGNRRLTSISPGGEVTVLADKYNGNRLNSPNDLWIDQKGGTYFTDPRYGREDNLEQDGFHVYYLPTAGGEPVRVTSDLKKPNGVIGTADGKSLFVADPGASRTYRYRINADGTLADKQLFVEHGSDGMTLDERGNLYLTSREGIAVFDSAGKALGVIPVPEGPANVTFGGKDNKTLFITARTGFYAVAMAVRGQ